MSTDRENKTLKLDDMIFRLVTLQEVSPWLELQVFNSSLLSTNDYICPLPNCKYCKSVFSKLLTCSFYSRVIVEHKTLFVICPIENTASHYFQNY